MRNPNFPDNLAIRPSVDPQGIDESAFGELVQQEAIEQYGIAGRVWEAAYALNMYLDNPMGYEFHPHFMSDEGPLTILELGSGMGIVASKIADKFAQVGRDLVVATDLPEVCPLLEINLRRHLSHSRSDGVVLVRPLAWGDFTHALRIASELSSLDRPHALTHIVCSDLVYFPELLAPLLRTLIQVSSPHLILSSHADSPTVIISYKIRSLPKETPFWTAFGLWFTFEPVLVRSTSGGSAWMRLGSLSDDPTFVFIARRRALSFDWHLPPDDQDLLDGVGAWGTGTRKADDTFESLLFMTLDAEGMGSGHN